MDSLILDFQPSELGKKKFPLLITYSACGYWTFVNDLVDFFTLFYWSVAALQCCINFYCSAK